MFSLKGSSLRPTCHQCRRASSTRLKCGCLSTLLREIASTASGSMVLLTSCCRHLPSRAANASATHLHLRSKSMLACRAIRIPNFGKIVAFSHNMQILFCLVCLRVTCTCRISRQCAADMGVETLEQRLLKNATCDVCTAAVTAQTPHDFNGYDLLCDKCFCHRSAASSSCYATSHHSRHCPAATSPCVALR